MKTTVQFAVLLLFGILFTITACTKDKHMADEHKDWNVLEWTVDGEQYKAECEGDPLFGCDPVDCQYYPDLNSLFLGGGNDENAIVLYKYRGISEEGMNIMQENDYIRFADFNKSDECRRYWIDTMLKYELKIDYVDTLQKVIEGNFEFTGISNCQDTVRVEDGYFKLTYRP